MAQHDERDRAESFGAWADDYDTHREGYPAELIEHLLVDNPQSVLDVGCGTGKLGRLFVAEGLSVTGVEPDARMAEVARSHGLTVDVVKLEEWDRAGRTFDLVTAGTSWHWIEPAAGATAAAEALNPGGQIALTWHFPSREPKVDAAMNAVYAEHAPDVESLADEADMEAIFAPLLAPPWTDPANDWFNWTQTYTADEWLAYLDTTSVHRMLPDAVRDAVYEGARAAIEANGGTLTVEYDTILLSARKS